MRFLLILLSLFLYTLAWGQFSEPNEISSSMALIRGQFTLDYDADGDEEIFVYSENDGKISCFENLDGDTFSDQIVILDGLNSLNSWSITSIRQYDLDSDGDLDICIALGADLFWSKNNSDGGFEELELFTNAHFCLDFLLMDVNEDGLDDFILGGYGDLVWIQNLGDGIFGEEILIDGSFMGSNGYIEAKDIDGDGDEDIVAVSNNGGDLGKIRWFEKNDGDFETGIDIATGINGYSHLNVLDFDSDGDNDIVLAEHLAGRIVFYENLDGLGDFSEEILLLHIPSAYGMSVTDFNNDSHPDVIAGFGETRVYFNDGTGELEPEFLMEERGCNNLIVSNLNGDDYPEIILTSHYRPEACIIPNVFGALGAKNCLNEDDILINPNSIAAVDIDLDGDIDVITTSDYGFSDKVLWYEQYENLEFSGLHIIDDEVSEPVAVCTGDMDSDGLEDILYASRGDGSVYWKKNAGGGTFYPREIITTEVLEPNFIKPFDFDSDGDLDIFVTSFADDKISWYENDGLGNFGTQLLLSTSNDGPKMIKIGDIDGDGVIDISCISENDGKITWYKNNNDGSFSTEHIVSEESGDGQAIDLIDLDGDLDLDIVYTTNGPVEGVSWYANDGEGNFGIGIFIYTPTSTHGPYEAVGCDIDLDNDIDILVIDYKTNTFGSLNICYNNGEEEFTEPFQVTGSFDGNFRNILLADLDGDLDNDILYTDRIREQINFLESYYLDLFQVRGNYYLDINNNGIKDSLEPPVPYGQVTSTPETYFSFTKPSGLYLMNFDEDLPGTYVVEPVIPELWEISSDSSSYHLTIDESFIFTDSMDFGIRPQTIQDSLSNDITGGFPRCNTIVNYWLSINNEGTTVPSGVAHLKLDEQLTYITADIEPDSIIGQNIYWSYDSLYYFEERSINLNVQMPDFTAIGDTLSSVFMITADSFDISVFEFYDTLNQELVCAYDPNDKTSEPKGIDSLGYISTEVNYIDYTIRFQNTGNDTAIHVRIEDQLDPNLDWSSLNTLAYSHNVDINVDPGGLIEFFFNEIMLPDSNVNFLGSQGFVKYRIYLQEDLPPGTEFNNTAEIYFDMNPPIITNTKIHTLYNCQSIVESLTYAPITCHGTLMTIDLGPYFAGINIEWNIDDIGSFSGPSIDWLADTSGNFEVSLTVTSDFCEADTSFVFDVVPSHVTNLDTILICSGDSTLIYEEYQEIEGSYVNELESIWGCDSTLTTYLKVVLSTINELDTAFCEGYGITLFGEYVNETGVYYDTLSSEMGCDSIIEIEVFENLSVYSDNEILSCPDIETLIFETYQIEEGIYIDTLTAASGCDSIAQIELIHFELSDFEMDTLSDHVICEGSAIYYLNSNLIGANFSGPGVIGDNFTPAEAGVGVHTLYSTYEDANGCILIDSITVEVESCLGIENKDIVMFNIFPNPSKDNFMIVSPNALSGCYNLNITDLSGRSVYESSNVKTESFLVNSAKWSSGVYIIKIYLSDHNLLHTEKLIIE